MIVVVKGEMPAKERMPEGLQKYIQTNTCTGTSHILTNPEFSIFLLFFRDFVLVKIMIID